MAQHFPSKLTSVAVVYNHTGEDHYEKLRETDPATLDFVPEYPLRVATIKEEYCAIAGALKKEGCRADLLNIEDNLSRLQHLFREDRPDVVFNLVEMFHGDPQLESAIAALFELYEIPYTGSAPFALELCQRKAITKQVLLKQGIATPGYRLLRTPKIPRRHGLRYPLIVKPAREDASIGVEAGSVVYDYEQLLNRVKLVIESFDPPVLAEEFITGKELHVSILGNDPPQVLPIIEFDFSSLPADYPAIITYDVKWNPLEQAYHRVHAICPARLPKKIEQAVKAQALQAYQATFCRDYARIDVRLTESGAPFVLEVNPNPDLTESVSFMQSAERAGLSFSQTLRKIVEFALARGKQRRVKLVGQGSATTNQ
jgi:D-alanine-D-alanine ligase